MKTFEDIKLAASKIGIVPGAQVKWTTSDNDEYIYTVPEYGKWYNVFGNAYAWRRSDGAPSGYCWLYGGDNSYYTPTVITSKLQDLACKPDEYMRKAIIEKARKLGLDVTNNAEHKPFGDGICWGRGKIAYVERRSAFNYITPGEFYDRLCRTVKPEPPICINDYEVKFFTGNIKVGCTEVPNDIVRKIAKQLKD